MNKYEALAFIFASMSTATGVAWMAWAWVKTRTVKPQPQQQVADSRRVEERLARIEQAVESIAIEVERVSEGQRFTTKLLAERADDGALVRPGRQDAR